MPDSHAEQILDAMRSLVVAADTDAADRIERGRIYPHEDDQAKYPAIGMMMGADVLEREHLSGFIDWELSVFFESVVRPAATYTSLESTLEQELNEMRKQIHAAIMATPTLGLSFVIDTVPVLAEAPVLDGEGKLPTGSQVIQFTVRYRSSRADISA